MKHLLICVILLLGALTPGRTQINLKKLATDKIKELGSKENIDKVGSLAKKSIEKARAEFDSTDFDYAILVSDNSGLFDIKEKGEQQARMLSMFNKGSALWKNEDIKPVEEARYHLEMGEMAYASSKFKFAEKEFDLAKEKYVTEGLTEELGYLKTISNQGLLYASMGRYTQAEPLTIEALELRKSKFGENNVSSAVSLNNYGVLKYNLARYNESEVDFESALNILKSNGLEGAMQYAIVLNNQAMLYQGIGRYPEAEQLLKSALSISANLEGKKNANHRKFQSNIALLYQQMGKYTDAEAIYLKMEKSMDKTNPDYASMLLNQAGLYMVMEKEAKVEELLKRAVGLYKASFGEESPAYARAISDLGNFYRYKERYPEAEKNLEKAHSIRETVLGKNHPLYVQSMEDIAILNWKRKNWDHAFMTYKSVMDKSLEFVNTYFPPMSESEKTKYWDVLSPRFQRFYNFALEASVENPAIVQELYDYHIATKALLLNSTNKVKEAILASKDGQLIKDYLTWLDQKETLARLYAYSKEELKTQKINLDSIERAANALEKKLSQRSTDFSAGYSTTRITYAQIRNTLTETEAVVEILRIQKYGQKFTDDAQYIGLILTRQSEVPKLVTLDNGSQLETRYFKFYRNAIQAKLNDEHSYTQFWGRIDPEVATKKTLYLSLDGVFNQLNIGTLKNPAGDFMVTKYDLVIVGNSKDLIALKSKKARVSKKTAMLMGFPDYGPGNVAALPGTKTEIDGVSKILKASGFQVSQFMQKTATESNLKKIKGPALVHIATHGYFLQDVNKQGSAFGIHLENANDNPLLRSGIILAGGAATVSGSKAPNLQSNDNGILTAYEAMNLNLNGTDLIILSACETGLGDVKAGEGVYGLQRAFLVAGADALIMSLWKVDDAATQQLMTNFYQNWMKLGNKQKAFKQAQLQLMTKYKEPYYWGAFVMMGN
jgi:CHAT domain-containing protein